MKDNSHLEIGHMQAQIAREQQQSVDLFLLGHISQYDPPTHRAKVIYPVYTNNQQSFTESGWVPLSTSWSGNGFGDQTAPYGGASTTDLTGKTNDPNANPEQVLVYIVEREGTFHVHGAFMFNNVDIPAGSNQAQFDSDGNIQMLTLTQGERIIRHSSGTYVHFKQDGSINIIANTTPHLPFVESDPSNLVREVNVQSITQDEPNTTTATSLMANTNIAARATTTGNDADVTTAATVTSSSSGNKDSTATNGVVSQATSSESGSGTASATNALSSTSTGKTTNSSVTISSTATGQTTSTAIGNFNVTAAQGSSSTATLGIVAQSGSMGNATANLKALGSTNAIINVQSDGSVTIQCPMNVLIDCPNIQLGTGTMERILTDVAAQVYNEHTHPVSGSVTGVPNQQIEPEDEAQNAYAS